MCRRIGVALTVGFLMSRLEQAMKRADLSGIKRTFSLAGLGRGRRPPSKVARGTLRRGPAPDPAVATHPEETSMLTMEKTADYVKRWVAAFESKDLDRVLAFYSNDVIFHSPLVARLSHDPSGTVQGKAALRAYVKKGFEVFDHIKFTVLDVLRGVDSIAIHYKGITGTHVVEVLFFDKDGVVRESYVHYASPE
jgi:ketosteroid isomerase-like protein